MGIHPACRSQLGAAERSQLGVLTCPTGRVLIWQHENGQTIFPLSSYGYTDMVSVYEGMGLTVHSNLEWSGSIRDYRLVFVVYSSVAFAISDPSWWPTIESGSWSGRIHLVGENPTVSPTNTWIDSKSSLTGISSPGLFPIIDFGCNQPGTVEPDDMTEGLTTFEYGGAGRISGGTALSKTKAGGTRPGTVWIARNKSGSIDWIVSADGDHIHDNCGVANNNNQPFVENLWNVDV